MSQENVELVKATIEAYIAGDRDAHLDFFSRDPARGAGSGYSEVTERRWNRTIQPWGCHGLLVLKTRWATRPLPLHDRS